MMVCAHCSDESVGFPGIRWAMRAQAVVPVMPR